MARVLLDRSDRLTLVHCMDVPDSHAKTAQDELKKAAAMLVAEHRLPSDQVVVRMLLCPEADVRDVLVDALEREQPDAVVLSSRHVFAPLRREYLGSVAAYVLRHSPVPLLVVPPAQLQP